MIATNSKYALTHPGLQDFSAALRFLQETDFSTHADGRIALDGERVFAIVQQYDTVAVDPPIFERHKRYLDIQYLAAGEEIIGWAPVDRMQPTGPFDAAKDIQFGAVEAGRWTGLRLAAGDLAVLWPEDAHAPRLAAGAASPVLKVVVKIAVG